MIVFSIMRWWDGMRLWKISRCCLGSGRWEDSIFSHVFFTSGCGVRVTVWCVDWIVVAAVLLVWCCLFLLYGSCGEPWVIGVDAGICSWFIICICLRHFSFGSHLGHFQLRFVAGQQRFCLGCSSPEVCSFGSGWFFKGFCSSRCDFGYRFPFVFIFFHPSLLVLLARACWLKKKSEFGIKD